MTLDEVDLKNPDLYLAGVPHELFTRLRRDDPVHWNPEPDGRGFWSITKYDDIVAISKNPAVFSSARAHGGHRIFDENVVGVAGLGAEETAAPMISMDPPEHNRFRRMLSPTFSPLRLKPLEERIHERVCAILDRLGARHECEFVTDIAAELPVQMLAELLGVPQEDRLKLFDWSNSLIAEDDPELRKSPEATARDVAAMIDYSARLWDQRLAHPGNDLISMLVHSQTPDGETMSKEQYLGTFILLVVAGNETTRNSISGGVIALAQFPDERRRLAANSGLMATAAAEIVRYVSPIMHMRRTAIADTELRGKQIRAGDKVILWYPSANRDEEIFTDPFRFNATRAELPQLGFGTGQHYCLGARLAEMQLRLFFTEFLRRYPNAEPVGPIRRMRSNFVAGIKEMPVRLH
ncbi:MAG TPA: cytochrome P450 [Candidatus Binataceae bacterium]|nr:cytochrome P450 [Candidatus Binataceae bacterium]